MGVTNFRKYLNARGFKQLVNCVLSFLARTTASTQGNTARKQRGDVVLVLQS